MNAPHVSVDVMDLIDAQATTSPSGEHQLYFPAEQFSFSFRTHPYTCIVDIMVVGGLYLLGNHGDDVLFMEYTSNPADVVQACRLTARSLTKSFPGEKMTLLPMRVLEVTGHQALVQLCHHPEVYWVVGYDDDGLLSVNDTNKN